MSGQSIKEQLLALGLARTGSRPRTRPEDQRRKTRPEPGLAEAFRLKDIAEHKDAANRRKRKVADDRRRMEVNRQVEKIVTSRRLNDAAAELSRHFVYKGRIRSIAVSREQLEALNKGLLGVVYLRGGYHLLRQEDVQAVARISEGHVPDLSGPAGEDDDHPVPDDLVW